MRPLTEIAGRRIGPGEPVYVIAEAGVNHNHDLSIAHLLIDAAADAGADAVKFQTWITEKLVRPGARKAEYQDAQCPGELDQFTLLKGLELPQAWHPELKTHAEARGITFLSTPDEIDSARFLCGLGVGVLKIGSAELTNLPYLRELARLERPLVVSTGMGTLEEVRIAVKTLETWGDVPIALLHCVSSYPAPEEEMNVWCLATLRDTFPGIPVGLSDHTTSDVAALLATATGMSILEKHLTLDRGLAGPDHAASEDPAGFARLVRALRHAEKVLGTGVKEPTPSELGTRTAVQKILLYARDLEKDHILVAEDFEALRCGLAGLPPTEALRLEGMTLTGQVRGGDPVHLDDVT